MKKITTFFALAIFTFAFNSCDAVNDLLPDVVLEKDFSASVPATIVAGSTSVNSDLSVDASTNSDFQKYKDNIKSVDITGFTYTLSNVTATEGTILNGTLSASGKSVAITNLTVKEGTSGVVTSEESAFFNALAADLKADGKATITLDGTVNNEDGSTFTIKIVPTIKFIFEVLK